MGMGDIEAAIVLEELARADVSSAILAQLTFNGPPRAIEHLGNDAMKDRWLPIAASGEALFCIGISETEAGSAVTTCGPGSPPDGDGYRLNAYKNYVTGGHKARCCLVWCRFPGSEGAKGIGAVVVDLEADGRHRRRHPREDGAARHERGRARLRRRVHRARGRAARAATRRTASRSRR